MNHVIMYLNEKHVVLVEDETGCYVAAGEFDTEKEAEAFTETLENQ